MSDDRRIARYNRNRNYVDPSPPPGARKYREFTKIQQRIIDIIAEMLASPEYNPITGLNNTDIAVQADCDIKTVQIFMKQHLDAAKYEIFQRVLCPELRYHDGLTRRDVFAEIFHRGTLQLDQDSLSIWLNRMGEHVVRRRDVAMRPLIAALARTDFGGEAAKTALRKDIGDEWFSSYRAFGSMVNAFRHSARLRTNETLSGETFIPLATMLTDYTDLLQTIGWPEDEPPTIMAEAVKAIMTWTLRPADDHETLEQRLHRISTPTGRTEDDAEVR